MPFLLIDKPVGPTSHDIVNQVRRATGERRVGHAGTLDPFASGLLIIGVTRESTRDLGNFLGMDKEYEATFVLGGESDTDDRMGKITPVPLPADLNEEKIKSAMKKFTGEIEQIPPAYSAIKIKGKKMYEAAREGKPLEARPRSVKIYEYELIPTFVGARHGAPQRTDESDGTDESDTTEIDRRGEWPFAPTMNIRVRVRCSSGTYIRALARDLGRELGTGGYVSELRRTKIGEYKVEDATPPPPRQPLKTS